MFIRYEFNGNFYSVCIGYKSKWFQQLSFFFITREFFDDKDEVCFAEIVFTT